MKVKVIFFYHAPFLILDQETGGSKHQYNESVLKPGVKFLCPNTLSLVSFAGMTLVSASSFGSGCLILDVPFAGKVTPCAG